MHVQEAVRILTKCGVTILGVFVYIPCPLCRVLARTHPILTTGVTDSRLTRDTRSRNRPGAAPAVMLSRRHRADRTATDIDFYNA